MSARSGPSAPARPSGPDRWPATVPAVAQMLRDGLDLPAGLTVLVGENGSGKSTVLGLVALLHDLTRAGAQAVVATHSPMIAAVPGARLLELGGWGMRAVSWDELDIVTHWRRFLREPDSYFRHWLDG
jgi:predicted ATPase